jgi:SAM-dependent methyltransferase
MGNLNDETIKTYQENFKKYAEKTPPITSGDFKDWLDLFISLLPKMAKIIELGSATGRDAKYFKSNGFEVFCTDVIPEALENLSKEGFKISIFDFRDDPKNEWTDNFDGLFANAVLLHAPQDIFEKALNNFKRIVKKNGIIAFSLKTGKGEEISIEKMGAPRYFRYHSKDEITKLLSTLNYEIISVKTSSDNKWLRIIIKNI